MDQIAKINDSWFHLGELQTTLKSFQSDMRIFFDPQAFFLIHANSETSCE